MLLTSEEFLRATLPAFAPKGAGGMDTKPNGYFHLKMRYSILGAALENKVIGVGE